MVPFGLCRVHYPGSLPLVILFLDPGFQAFRRSIMAALPKEQLRAWTHALRFQASQEHFHIRLPGYCQVQTL